MCTSRSELADLFSAFRPLFTRPTYARALILLEGALLSLGFLSVLAPSQRYCAERGRRHKTIVRCARQMILQLCRWLPGRQITVLTDVGYAGQQLLSAVCPRVTVVGQLRLDSALYDFPPPRTPGKRGPQRKKGDRQPSLKERLLDPKTEWTRVRGCFWYGEREVELDIATGLSVWYHAGAPAVRIRWVLVRDPQGKREARAYFSTDLSMEALEILRHYIRRWSVEVTFEEARRHLGIETQRQWSDRAIARTTPCLLGAFSITALLADRLQTRGLLRVRSAAWYEKPKPTFSDALAAVRRHLWEARNTSHSRSDGEDEEFPAPLLRCMIETLAYAA